MWRQALRRICTDRRWVATNGPVKRGASGVARSSHLNASGHHTPRSYIRQAFCNCLECGILAHDFARAWCDDSLFVIWPCALGCLASGHGCGCPQTFANNFEVGAVPRVPRQDELPCVPAAGIAFDHVAIPARCIGIKRWGPIKCKPFNAACRGGAGTSQATASTRQE